MTPKEKAKELVFNKFIGYVKFNNEGLIIPYAKKCALIAVDEIINTILDLHIKADSEMIFQSIMYWEQVKQEIEKL